MPQRQCRKYNPEFKEQIIKEVLDTGKVLVVARNHNIPIATVHTWIQKNSVFNSPGTFCKKVPGTTAIQLKRKLADAELEIRVLKELLKKTNQAWLKN